MLIVQRFLAFVDLLGTTYSASTLATGYGAYIAQPLLRKAVEGHESTLTEAEAEAIMESCMKVLFYRDARSLNKVNQDWATTKCARLIIRCSTKLQQSRQKERRFLNQRRWTRSGLLLRVSEVTVHRHNE